VLFILYSNTQSNILSSGILAPAASDGPTVDE
jgi:hypothetical protein